MKQFRKYLPTLIVFFIGVIISLLLYDFERKEEIKEKSEYIENHILERRYAIENEMKSNLNILKLFKHDWDVLYHEFENLAKPILISHESVSNLYWVEKVAHEKEFSIEKKIIENGIESFNITEFNVSGELIIAKKSDFYFPIFHKGSNINNELVEGYDLGSIKRVKHEFEEAMETRELRITECLDLFNDSNKLVFFAIHPIFITNQNFTNKKQEVLKGFVVAACDISRIIENSITKFKEENIGISISEEIDLSDTREIYSLTLKSDKNNKAIKNSQKRMQSFSYSMKIANRIWKLEFYTLELLFKDNHASFMLKMAIMLTIIITFYLNISNTRSEKVRKLTKELMSEIEEKNKIEKVLRESEEKYRAAFLTSPDAINITTMEGIYVDINEGFTRITDYTRDDVIGESALEKNIWTKPEDRKFLISELKSKGECNNLESVFRCKNGKSMTGLVSAKIIHLEQKSHVISITRDITTQKEREKLILKTILDTEEKERKRFTQDLHDELGPFLSGIKLYIKELGYQDVSYDQRLSIIEYLNEFIDSAVEKTRSISNQLMPNILTDYGLVKALNLFCTRISNTKEINIEFESNITEKIDNSTVEVILYRVTIELINNTIKHANADLINISLNRFEEILQLTYVDNGKGFELEKELVKEKGQGLNNIVNRLNSIKGKYKFAKKSKGIYFNIIIDLSLI